MKIVFFSPNPGIVPHFSAETRLANILKNSKKHEVMFLSCDSFFEKDCSVARYLKVKIDNREKKISANCNICNLAIKQSQIARKFNCDFLRKYWKTEDQEIFNQQIELIRKSPADYLYRGIAFGKMAAYELILEFKKKDLNFSQIENEIFINYIENCLRTYLAGCRFLEEYLPDRVILFNPQYGVNSAFCAAAESLNIRVDALAFSNILFEMRSYIRLWNWTKYRNVTPGRSSENYELTEINAIYKFRLRRNLEFIRKATSPWTYSQPAQGSDIRRILQIPRESKILLAVMNSLDEQFAAVTSEIWPVEFASKRVFENQEEWLRSLIDFSSKEKELALVIRLHPREFPNKRESVMAEAHQERAQLFGQLPENVRLDHPSLGIPIEDYFEETTAITTGWSSVGLEWQIRGIPCVTYDSNLPMYPNRTHLASTSKEEYFMNLSYVLSTKFIQNEKLKSNATKWYAYANFKGTVRIGTSVLEEIYLGQFFKRMKITGFLNRYFPRIKSWIDLKSPSLHTGSKKVLRYFEDDLNSLQEF